jgi:hypothetical protein
LIFENDFNFDCPQTGECLMNSRFHLRNSLGIDEATVA